MYPQDELLAQMQERVALLEQENALLRCQLAEQSGSHLQAHEQSQSSRQSMTSTSATEYRLLEATASAATALLRIDSFDQAINTALQILGESLETDRARVLESLCDDPVHPFSRYHNVLYEWIKPGMVQQRSPSQAEHIDTKNLEGFFETFVQNKGFGGLLSEWDASLQALFPGAQVKSVYAVPIWVKGQWWGILAFDDCQEAKHRTPAELAALQTAANCIGSAIQRQRMQQAREEAEQQVLLREQAAQERAAELAKANEALYRGVERLTEVGNIDALLDSFLLETMTVTGASAGAVFDRVAGTQFQMRSLAQDGVVNRVFDSHATESAFKEVTTRDPVGVFRQLAEGQVYCHEVDDYFASWLPEAAAYHRQQGHQVCWNFPFRIGKEVAGYLGLAFREKRLPNQLMTETIQALTYQVSLALETSRLAEEAKQVAIAREQEKAAQERVAELAKANEALRGTTDRLANEPSINAVLGHVLSEACRQVNCDAGAIFLYDEALEQLSLTVGIGIEAYPYSRQMLLPTADYPGWPLLLQTRKPLFFHPDVNPEMYGKGTLEWHRAQGHDGILATALMLGDRPLGQIAVAFRNKHDFQETDLELFQALAQQATLAVQLMHLAEAAQQAAIARERENAAQERAAELEKANEALARTAVRLTEQGDLNYFFDELLLETSRQLGADSAHLVVYDNKQRRYNSLHQHNGNVKHEAELPASFSLDEMQLENFHTIAQRERCPHWYDPQADADLFSPGAGEFLSRVGLQSVLHVPLLVGEQIVGGIGFAFREPNPECGQRQVLVEALAHQAALAIQLIQLAEEAQQAAILAERNRMAGEIHDTLAQSFTGIIIQIGAANQVLTDDLEATQSHLEMIAELARTGLSEARRSVTALRPQLLEEGSLESALCRLATQMRASTNIALVYETKGTTYPLPAEVENNLLRMGQEALTNAVKYARASEIRVELMYEKVQCILRVKDNGQGFGVGSIRPGGGGFGLLGMSERAERIGAQLLIQSQPGQGAEVVVTIQRERTS
jgi:signal transduction histidine kinase